MALLNSIPHVSKATRKRAQEAVLEALLADDGRRRALWSALLSSNSAGDAAVAVENWAEPYVGHTDGWVGAWGWHYWRRRKRDPLPPSVATVVANTEAARGILSRAHSSRALHASWFVRYRSLGETLASIRASAPHVASDQAVLNGIQRIAAQAGLQLPARRRGRRRRGNDLHR